MLKIQRTGNHKVILSLIGRLGLEEIAELKKVLAAEPNGSRLVLDLKELTLVDREGVIFLGECRAKDIELENCQTYIREWMARERGS